MYLKFKRYLNGYTRTPNIRRFVMERYIGTIDDFMKDNNLDPVLKPIIEPIFKEMEYQIFTYLLGALS